MLDHWLAILEDAELRAKAGPVVDPDVDEALDALGSYVEAGTIDWLRSSLATLHDIGRTQNVNASMNRLRLLLRG